MWVSSKSLEFVFVTLVNNIQTYISKVIVFFCLYIFQNKLVANKLQFFIITVLLLIGLEISTLECRLLKINQ